MIHLVGIGEGISVGALDTLSAGLARELQVACRVRTEPLDPAFAYDPVRNQYHATSLLRYLTTLAGDARLLGVASVDLFVPIFTFVYGEAQLAGSCALISEYRLRQTFYGLATDGKLTEQRLLKEALHELGHTYGLRHCHDWSCPMASSTTVERLDVKNMSYCIRCWRAIHGL